MQAKRRKLQKKKAEAAASQQPSLSGTTAGTYFIGLPPKHDPGQRGTAGEADAASKSDAGKAYDTHTAADQRSRTPTKPSVLGGRAKALHSLQKQEAKSLEGGRNRTSALRNGLFSRGARGEGIDLTDTEDKKRNVEKSTNLRRLYVLQCILELKKFKKIHVCSVCSGF